MNIEHQRKAFQYAIGFLENEINSLKNTLSQAHLLNSNKKILEQRLKGLENDYADLSKYGYQN